MYKISCDPGSTAAGIALWEGKNPILVKNVYPDREAKESKDNFLKTDSIMRQLEDLIDVEWNIGSKLEEIYCEVPVFFDSPRGQAVAASGDLVKLTLFVGNLQGFCRTWNIKFTPVRVIDWRGTLPDQIVQKRVIHLLSEEVIEKLKPKSHCWDSLGIGSYGITGNPI